MKILVVFPPEYGFTSMVSHGYMMSTSRVATVLKKQGHDVEVFDIRPRLPGYSCISTGYKSFHKCYKNRIVGSWNCKNIWNAKDGDWYYKEEPIFQVMGTRKCGNWENEHLSKTIVRIGRPQESYIKKLLDFKPDKVVITQLFTYQWEGVKETIDVTKRVLPSAFVEIGGLYPALVPWHAKTLGADGVFIKPVGNVLDFTPTDLSIYDEPPCTVTILTELGCPNGCGYCAVSNIEGRKMVLRPIKEVVDEIEYYVNNGIGDIEFLDSNFLIHWEDHFKLILEEIIRRKIKCLFKSYGGIDGRFMTEEMAELMAKAGFTFLGIPIESTSSKLLNRWNRNFPPRKYTEKFKRINKILHVNSFFMIGCLDQTYEEVKDTLDYVFELGTTPVPLFFTPIPGTTEWGHVLPRLPKDWTLESLHPALCPLASPQLTVEQLHEVWNKHQANCLNNRYGTPAHTELVKDEVIPNTIP